MLPQDLHTLGVSITNRILQWCAVVLIFETSIDPIITDELCEGGEAVVDYCPVQCGAVGAVRGEGDKFISHFERQNKTLNISFLIHPAGK